MYEGSQAASQIAATQNAQNQANAEWVAYQTRIHNEQAQAEDDARNKATAAQQDTLNKVSPQAQTATQTAEQQRLNSLYNQPGAGAAQDPNAPQGMLLSGEGTGNRQDMGGITSQINQATTQARQRIAALATASSYGGSFGGLGTTVPIAFAQGGNAINLQNAIRQGNLKTYGVEQQVQPLQYTVGPGTEATAGLAKSLGSVAGTLAGAAGPKALSGLSGASGIFGGAGAGGDFSDLDFAGAAGTPDFSNLPANVFG